MASNSRRSLSLQRRLIILLLLVGLVPLLVVAMLNNLQSAETLTTLANRQLSELAFSASEKLQQDLFDRSGNVQTFANSDAARSLDPLRITPLMTRMTTIYQPYYPLMLVTNAQGVIIAASSSTPDGTFLNGAQFLGDSVRGEEWFEIWSDRRAKSGQPFFDDIRVDRRVELLYGTNNFVLTISHGIYNQRGSLIGVWVNYIDWQQMESLLQDSIARPLSQGGSTIQLTLLNRDSVILASSTGLIPLQRTYSPPDDSLIQFATVAYGNSQQPLGWSVVATQSRLEALSTARRQTFQTLLAALALGILAVIVGVMVTRAITQPLQALQVSAESVAQGNLYVHAPEGPGEIGQVARAFNSMTTELRGLYASLEDQVSQRTAELESTLVHLKQRTTELQLSQQQLSATNATLSDSEARYRSLFERTQAILHETQVLYGMAQSLINSDSIESVLKHGLDGALEALSAHGVSLLMVDNETKTIVHQISGGPGRVLVPIVSYADLLTGLPGWVVKHKKPALSPGDVSDPRDSALDTAFRKKYSIGSVIMTPLLYRNDLFGIMVAFNLIDQRAFTAYEVELMVTIANQSAVALQNVLLYSSAQQELTERRRIEEELRLYQGQLEQQVQVRTMELADTAAKLQDINDLLQADVALARDIQAGLLPLHSPWPVELIEVAAHSLPAAEVGGDFYTYIPDPQYGGTVVVGDISGKGVGAALLMALVLSALENEQPHAMRPDLIVNRINHALYERLQHNRMNAAMCLVAINLQARLLYVINAGMIAPFVLRKGKVTLLDVGAFPVGMAELTYTSVVVPFQDNDVVVMVSDGVVEAHNRFAELYGFERLELCLTAAPITSTLAELVEHVLQDVLAFMQSSHPHDDLTIVAFRPYGRARFSKSI